MASLKISEIEAGSQIRFSIYGNIGGKKEFTGTVASSAAGEFLPPGTSADINHVNIYPTLPSAVKAVTENAYTAYNYIALSLADKSIVYIGKPWIVETTLMRVVPRVATVTVQGITDPDGTKLRRVLESNGYSVSSVTISE